MDVMSAKQRNWNLQMQTFLMCQNGSIMDALLKWTRNVSKHFEGACMFYSLVLSRCKISMVKFAGANQCTICYSVVHPTTHMLPEKVRYYQCKLLLYSVL